MKTVQHTKRSFPTALVLAALATGFAGNLNRLVAQEPPAPKAASKLVFEHERDMYVSFDRDVLHWSGGLLLGYPGRGGARITVAAPLTLAHAAGAQVSGTGITLTAALTRAHAGGAQVASDSPTPGAPNKYYRRP